MGIQGILKTQKAAIDKSDPVAGNPYSYGLPNRAC